MKTTFNPIRTTPGLFRVALNISELGDRAWEILALSQTLGFDPPKFETHVRPSEIVEIWAVVLEQIHSFDADPMTVIDPWDEQMWELSQACGDDPHTKMMITNNLRECLFYVA